MAWVNESKNQSTFTLKIRHGVDPTLLDLQNFTFTDDIFGDGRQLKDITFTEFANQVWANTSKNTSTFSNVAKS